jgi:ABC-type glycerol-3-phosphate transport system permease component
MQSVRFAGLIFLPVVWLALTAFKLPIDTYSTKIFFEPTLKNFQTIFLPPRSFGPMVINSNLWWWSLTLTRREATTLTIGFMSLNAERGILWEQMAAAGLIVMIPIFFLSFSIRRYFVEGITMGAVK